VSFTVGLRKDLYTPEALLHCLLCYCIDPEESRALSDEWLDVISSLGVDTDDCLKGLTPGMTWSIGQEDSLFERQVVISLENTPRLYWDWMIDTQEPVSLVCDEFTPVVGFFLLGLLIASGLVVVVIVATIVLTGLTLVLAIAMKVQLAANLGPMGDSR